MRPRWQFIGLSRNRPGIFLAHAIFTVLAASRFQAAGHFTASNRVDGRYHLVVRGAALCRNTSILYSLIGKVKLYPAMFVFIKLL